MANEKHGLRLQVGDLAKVIAPYDGYAGNGDIVKLYENTGGAYDFKCRKIGDETSRGTLFDAEDLEPYSEEKPLKPGDLAKVVADKTTFGGEVGEVVKIVANNGRPNHPYKCNDLDGGNFKDNPWAHGDELAIYEPQAGDTLTIGGVDYMLEQRKAKVGEKVLIVDADVQLEREYANGDVFTVKEHALLSDIYTEEANRYINYAEYLVLAPVSEAKRELTDEDVKAAGYPLVFIQRKAGDNWDVYEDGEKVAQGLRGVTIDAHIDNATEHTLTFVSGMTTKAVSE